MQHEVVTRQMLLDAEGKIAEEGWSRFPAWEYSREAIHASKLRIKEWDYYYIISHKHQIGLSVTFSDLGYIGMMAVCFLYLAGGTVSQQDRITFLPFGRHGLHPSSGSGEISFSAPDLQIRISTDSQVRRITIRADKLQVPHRTQGLAADITLTRPENDQSMNIATSWKENRKAFYLNEKVTCMQAAGTITAGETVYRLDEHQDAGGLDWGRGRWTYKNRWYWGSASGYIDDTPFGFNLGYGFSDRTPASENVLFYDHRIHKLEEVTFHIDTEDYMRPWRFTSSDGRLELEFTPVVDRHSKTDLVIVRSLQHQVFGRFSGRAILDDGRELEIRDLLGFAEDVLNLW